MKHSHTLFMHIFPGLIQYQNHIHTNAVYIFREYFRRHFDDALKSKQLLCVIAFWMNFTNRSIL